MFDAASNQWHARRGRAHYQPTASQLPKMDQRWTDIVTGSPAEDVTTPKHMMLPTSAIEGDIIQLTDPSNSRFYTVNDPASYLSSQPRTFRYDSQAGRWIIQKP